jgi:hypothetical protein
VLLDWIVFVKFEDNKVQNLASSCTYIFQFVVRFAEHCDIYLFHGLFKDSELNS